jgi:hypothetical protein
VSTVRVVGLLVASLIATGALAGQSCEPRRPAAAEVRAGLELAYKVHRHLEASGASVAVIGRVGRDLSEHGLRYSHVGLALRSEPERRWTVLHLLNHCGRADSDLYEQGLGNFFLDDLFRFEAVVLLPSPELQSRVLVALAGGAARRVHQPAYSLIAHPYSARYQNSNQWLLELVASALAGEPFSRGQAHAHLARMGFRPSALHLPPLKRLGARLFSVNVQFDDHAWEEWSSSRYQVVSAESVLAFLATTDRSMGQSVVTLP